MLHTRAEQSEACRNLRWTRVATVASQLAAAAAAFCGVLGGAVSPTLQLTDTQQTIDNR